jgi:hypothetical protein
MKAVSAILFAALLLNPAIAQSTSGVEDFETSIDDTSRTDSMSVPDTTAPQPFTQDNVPLQTAPDSVNGSDTSIAPIPHTDTPPAREASITPLHPTKFADTLAGNLPRLIEARDEPYLVTSDIYVPSGKTVTIKPGTIVLFKNFTEFHIEGRLIAEGTENRPIVFSSELDQAYNSGATLKANPYDWNGVFIHEGGLGSSLKNCSVCYTVYGINSLTRYIRVERVTFRNNGRTDLTIEGKQHQVSDKPYSYALTINDAKKDGVPVEILMDPQAKRRTILRYGGFSLVAGGLTMGVWSLVLLNHDQQSLDTLSKKVVIDQNSPIVAKLKRDWEKARDDRNRDRWMAGISFLLASAGSAGVVWSFLF